MNESDAKSALIAMGTIPTRQLIENWLRAERAETAQSGQPVEWLHSASNQQDWQQQAQALAARF